MSDSEDEAAFASADEGEDETGSAENGGTKETSTKLREKQQETGKSDTKQEVKPSDSTAENKAKGQSGKEKFINAKPENKNKSADKGAGGKQAQVKTQVQGKGKGGKNTKGKGNKGKSVEKQSSRTEEKVATTSSAKEVESENKGPLDTKTEELSKTQDTDKSESPNKNIVESAESRISENSEVKTSKSDDINSTDNSEMKNISLDGDGKDTGDKSAESVASPQGQSIPRQKNQQKEEPKAALDRLADDEESGDSWSWGNWGTSLMDVASSSVSTFTHQVGEGFSTIIDTVETTLGAPSPEELVMAQGIKEPEEETIENAPEEASIDRAEDIKAENVDSNENKESNEKKEPENSETEGESKKPQSGGGGGWFSGWGMSSLTSVVQNTTNIVQSKSKNLVSGGLDVLETIGKKTIDVIKEHDPGLKKTKDLFLFDKGDKQNLSSLLREAKEEAAFKAEKEKEYEENRKAHFGCMFDEYQGLAHLEALEMLSNQCEKKVQTLLTSMPTDTLSKIKTELIQIKQVFEREEDDEEEEEMEHDFSKLVTEHLTEFHLGTTPNKLNKTQEKIRQGIAEFYDQKEEETKYDPKIVHQTAIQSLAELTSKSVEQFHKAGELVLLQKDSDKKFLDRSKSLSGFTKVLCTEVGILSTKFSHCLNKLAEEMEDSSVVNPLVTNIYLEATNSSTYIQDAFQLLLPCLQQAMIESTIEK